MKTETYEALNQKVRMYFWMKKELHSGVIQSEMVLDDSIVKAEKMKNGVLFKIGDIYKHSFGKLIKVKGQVFSEKHLIYGSRMDAESKRSSYFPTKRMKISHYEKGEEILIEGKKRVVKGYNIIIKKDHAKVLYHT